MLRTLWRKKVLIVFLVALLVLLPAASVRPAQALSKNVFLSVGIEKSAAGVTVTGVAMFGARTSGGGGAGGGGAGEKPKSVSGDGATVEEAFEQITANSGRAVSLAHCNMLVLGASLAGENVAEILRYFIERFEISSNALLVWTDAPVADVLDASFAARADSPGGSLETIAAYNQETLFKRPLTLDKFYKDYLKGRDGYMSAVTLTEGEICNTQLLAAFAGGVFKGWEGC